MAEPTPPPVEPGDGSESGGAPESERRSRSWLRWPRRLVLALLLLVAAAVAVLNWAPPGQRLVVDRGLDFLRGELAGTLQVDEVRSGSLLAGVTLVGVRLDTEDGRPFLTADSLRGRWSLPGLLTGRPSLSSVTAWGLRVEISSYEEGQPLTVERLLPESEPRPDSVAGSPTEVGLGRVRVVDGLLEVLTPAAPGDTVGVVPAPDGEGTLSRLALEELELELDRAVLTVGGVEPFRAFLVRLATDVSFGPRPIEVVGAEGHLRWGPLGLTVDEGHYRFPGSVMAGRIELGPRVTEGEGWAFGADLATDGPGSLEDLRWIDPRIPDGAFQGEVGVTVADAVSVELRDAVVDLEASDLVLDGAVRVDDEVRFDEFRVRASPLVLGRLEPWIEAELPLAGFLTGELTFNGPLSSLGTRGRVTLAPEAVGGGPTVAEVRGTLRLGAEPGATNLEVTLDPLNFGVVDAVLPGPVPAGPGRALLTASGRLSEGIRVVADVTHGTDTLSSRVVSRGTVARPRNGMWRLDLLTDLTPFSLELLQGLVPERRIQGRLQGSVRTVGPLDSLRVLGSADVAGGTVEVDTRVNVLAPDSLYRVRAELREVTLSRVAPGLPDPSVWTGTVEVEGRGLTLDSLAARGRMSARASRLGGLHVDSVEAVVEARDGLLTVDTLLASLGGVSVRGGGTLGLLGAREGEARLQLRAESLAGLRPLLLGDTVIAGDTLTIMERELLRFEGIDPDTLPAAAEVAMAGALEADLRLQGWLEAFGVEGSATLLRGVYGENRVDSVSATFQARALPSFSGQVSLELAGRGLEMEDRSFETFQATLSMEERAGEASVEVVREPGERLVAEGSFAVDSLGAGEVGLARARLELDSLAWETTGPSRIAWEPGAVRLREVEIRRPGGEPMHLTAEGTLAWEGESDLDLDVQGLHLELIAALLEMEEPELAGTVDMELDVRGPAARPAIDGRVRWREARYREVAMDSLAGTLRYRERTAQLDVAAWDDDRRTFVARGTVPVDLALDSVGDRSVARPMDLRVEADSLAAANVLSFLDFLEDVEGRVSGEFDIGGTLDRPEPQGVFRLDEGAWTMEALGVRHRGVSGTLTLRPDRRVEVELETRAAGTSTVTGTVVLEPLRDPRLDLAIGFEAFQAVSRADIEGRISGDLTLTGRFRQPLVQGALQVDQGTLFLEEFARSAEIVDLSDPRILEVVDTTALSTRPILAGVRNPFLEKLRVDIDLSVPRATWLRSPDMNVEMGGELLVTYDRTNRDLVMVGELEALRGSYTVLGRSFQVEEGTVGFIGTPGINPTLDIQAVARIRQREGEPLSVTATVSGNLTQPRVQLSTEEAGLTESDLVSYLIFGTPAADLASGQTSWQEGGGLLGAAYYGATSIISGTLASRLGSALAREVGVDYLNVTQLGNLAASQGGLAGTQVEVGQYVGEDVFIVLILRPPTEQGTLGPFGGARIEWALNDPYTLEGFIEDRFLRSGVSGFRDLGFEPSRILGVFIFREWGY